MKKTNFLKGLAAVVLGCMFTSCEKENLSATFWAGPAQVTLEVEVFDALSGSDVTSQANISVSSTSFVANGTTEFNYGIKDPQTITITATVGEGTATSDVIINPIRTSGKAKYYVKLIVADGLKFTTKTVGTTEKESYAKFQDLSHNANHANDGATWYSNATDYFQPYTVNYEIVKASYSNFSELEEGSFYSNLDELHTAAIKAAYENLVNTKASIEKATYENKASAWSYFNALVTVTTTNYKWTAETINSAEVAASCTYDGISSTEAEHVEFAHPNHAGHYEEGHGHGHGNNANAGGGISIAE